jgi:23S rRNA (uracil1939-C5)-methyltransferase
MLACPHRPPCPGCPALSRTLWPAEARHLLEALCAETGVALPPLETGPPTAFRRRARLAVRGRASAPKIGIFEAGSHRIVHIPRCLVHDPRINEAAEALGSAIRETRAPPYADDVHKGLIRYVQLVVERRSRTVQIVLVGNTDDLSVLAPLGEALRRRSGSKLHSLWLNGHTARSNAILGERWEHITGPRAVEEAIAGARVFFPPGAFGQSHLDLAERLVARVQGWVPAGQRVLELYAGTGAIGLGLVGRSAHVTFNEIAPGSLEGLALGIAALGTEERERITVRPGPADAVLDALDASDVVIVDPPRKGLDRGVTDAIADRAPEQLIYVACGLPAFVRDARRLVESRRMVLAELAAFDLFAHTEHVEVVARFQRSFGT